MFLMPQFYKRMQIFSFHFVVLFYFNNEKPIVIYKLNINDYNYVLLDLCIYLFSFFLLVFFYRDIRLTKLLNPNLLL